MNCLGSFDMMLLGLIVKKNVKKMFLNLANNYILKNFYIILGSTCFLQLIGIRMDSESTPFMANLFFTFMKRIGFFQTKNRDLWKARIFSNIFLVYRHLYSINNSEFENIYSDFYPDELELKKENKILLNHHFWTFQ